MTEEQERGLVRIHIVPPVGGQPIGCPYCDGTGRQPGPVNAVGYQGTPRICPNCHGRGAVVPEAGIF